MYSIEKIHESCWCSSSIACQEKRADWILRLFTLSVKNPLNLRIILTFQFFFFFWGSKWTRSNLISHKTIWHISNIKNSEFKLKNARFYETPFYFSFIFLDNTSHKFWNQSPSSDCQCCLKVSETVSCHKLRCCYSVRYCSPWDQVLAIV